jgi:hypothetical protein
MWKFALLNFLSSYNKIEYFIGMYIYVRLSDDKKFKEKLSLISCRFGQDGNSLVR